MNRILIVAASVISLAVIVAGAIVFMDDRKPTISRPQTGHNPVHLQEVEYHIHHKGKPVCSVSVSDFRITPRKFGVFSIKSINELQISGVRADFFLGTDNLKDNPAKSSLTGSKDLDLFKPLMEMGGVNRRGSGLLTKATIRDIEINMLLDGERQTLKVTAPSIKFPSKNSAPELQNPVFLNPLSGEKIRARSAIWDTRNQKFLIPGWYELNLKNKTIKDKGISIDFHGSFNTEDWVIMRQRKGILDL